MAVIDEHNPGVLPYQIPAQQTARQSLPEDKIVVFGWL